MLSLSFWVSLGATVSTDTCVDSRLGPWNRLNRPEPLCECRWWKVTYESKRTRTGTNKKYLRHTRPVHGERNTFPRVSSRSCVNKHRTSEKNTFSIYKWYKVLSRPIDIKCLFSKEVILGTRWWQRSDVRHS